MVLCASVAAAVAQMHAKGAGLLVVFAMPPPPPPGASNSAGESPADHYARVAGAAMARHTLPGAAAALSAAGAVGVVVFAGTADAAALTRRHGPPPRLPATYFIAANGELRGVAGGYLSPGGLASALAARGGGRASRLPRRWWRRRPPQQRRPRHRRTRRAGERGRGGRMKLSTVRMVPQRRAPLLPPLPPAGT